MLIPESSRVSVEYLPNLTLAKVSASVRPPKAGKAVSMAYKMHPIDHMSHFSLYVRSGKITSGAMYYGVPNGYPSVADGRGFFIKGTSSRPKVD